MGQKRTLSLFFTQPIWSASTSLRCARPVHHRPSGSLMPHHGECRATVATPPTRSRSVHCSRRKAVYDDVIVVILIPNDGMPGRIRAAEKLM
jgi:hypothetical protein